MRWVEWLIHCLDSYLPGSKALLTRSSIPFSGPLSSSSFPSPMVKTLNSSIVSNLQYYVILEFLYQIVRQTTVKKFRFQMECPSV